jgi:hypothetical protein
MYDIKKTCGVTQGYIDFDNLDKPFELVFVEIFDVLPKKKNQKTSQRIPSIDLKNLTSNS